MVDFKPDPGYENKWKTKYEEAEKERKHILAMYLEANQAAIDAEAALTHLFELFGSTKEFNHKNMVECIEKGVNEVKAELVREIDELSEKYSEQLNLANSYKGHMNAFKMLFKDKVARVNTLEAWQEKVCSIFVDAPRFGAEEDSPEGAQWIQLSTTLVRKLVRESNANEN